MVHQAGRDVDHVPAVAWASMARDRGAGNLEEAAQVHTGDGVVVVVGVVGERFGDEDPRIVDHGVDPTEPLQGGIDDPLSDPGLRDVAGHRQHHRVVALGDRARVGDDGVAELAVSRKPGRRRCPGRLR